MSHKTETPTGKPFEFEIDSASKTIIITAQSGAKHGYSLNALKDLYDWLRTDQKGEWVELGTKGEEEKPNEGTVEEWARSSSNPNGDFYGTTRGRKGRFASYLPSILEVFGFVEVEHKSKGNRVRSLPPKM